MKNFLLLLIITTCLFSCFTQKPKIDLVDIKMSMMDADRAFSKMSELKGMKAAFMEYIDSNGVLLRPNARPIIGGEAIFYISQGEDTSYTMTWDPKGGNVAQSGDMGYTYGIYSIKPKDSETVQYGTYVSIWKKQPDGKWKFILDSGNEGVGEME